MAAIEESGEYCVTRSKGWGPGLQDPQGDLPAPGRGPGAAVLQADTAGPRIHHRAVAPGWHPDRLHQRPRAAGKLMPHRRDHSRNSTIWDHRSYKRAPKQIGLGVAGSNPLQNVKGFGAADGQNASSGFPAARVVPINRPFLTIDVAGSLRAAAACCAGNRSNISHHDEKRSAGDRELSLSS